MLFRRNKKEAAEEELHKYVHVYASARADSNVFMIVLADVCSRMYRSMHNAVEELRLLDPPGTKDAGRLYRIALEKKGIYRPEGVPIEYGRGQMETPGKEPWNYDWTR